MDRGPASWEAERRPTNIGDLKSLLSSLNAIEVAGVAALQGKLTAVDVASLAPQPSRTTTTTTTTTLAGAGRRGRPRAMRAAASRSTGSLSGRSTGPDVLQAGVPSHAHTTRAGGADDADPADALDLFEANNLPPTSQPSLPPLATNATAVALEQKFMQQVHESPLDDLYQALQRHSTTKRAVPPLRNPPRLDRPEVAPRLGVALGSAPAGFDAARDGAAPTVAAPPLSGRARLVPQLELNPSATDKGLNGAISPALLQETAVIAAAHEPAQLNFQTSLARHQVWAAHQQVAFAAERRANSALSHIYGHEVEAILDSSKRALPLEYLVEHDMGNFAAGSGMEKILQAMEKLIMQSYGQGMQRWRKFVEHSRLEQLDAAVRVVQSEWRGGESRQWVREARRKESDAKRRRQQIFAERRRTRTNAARCIIGALRRYRFRSTVWDMVERIRMARALQRGWNNKLARDQGWAEIARYIVEQRSAELIQRVFRAYVGRKRFKKLKMVAHHEKNEERFIDPHTTLIANFEMHGAAKKLQHWWTYLPWRSRRRWRRLRLYYTKRLQRNFRTYLAHKKVAKLREAKRNREGGHSKKHTSALAIQSLARGMAVRTKFAGQLGAVKAARLAEYEEMRKQFEARFSPKNPILQGKFKKAAIKIQRISRGYVARKKFGIVKLQRLADKVVIIQRAITHYLWRRKRVHAANFMQRWLRRTLASLILKRRAAVVIQTGWRTCMAKTMYLSFRRATRQLSFYFVPIIRDYARRYTTRREDAQRIWFAENKLAGAKIFNLSREDEIKRQILVMTQVDDPEIPAETQAIYVYYCSFGSRGNNRRLGVNNFTKLCKECPKLIDSKNLNQQDCELIFKKSLGKLAGGGTESHLHYAEFLIALEHVAEAKLKTTASWGNRLRGSSAKLVKLLQLYIFKCPAAVKVIKDLKSQAAPGRADTHIRNAAGKIQRSYCGYVTRCDYKSRRGEAGKMREHQVEFEAAVRIQKTWLGKKARKDVAAVAKSVWEKYVDHETGREYWYNTRTGNAVWRKPKALGTGDIGNPVKMPQGADVFTVHCKSCMENLGTTFCIECNELHCKSCSRVMHGKGRRQGHDVVGLEVCVQCDFQVGTRFCFTCKDNYCDNCFEDQHSKGMLQRHEYKALVHVCEECGKRGARQIVHDYLPEKPPIRKLCNGCTTLSRGLAPDATIEELVYRPFKIDEFLAEKQAEKERREREELFNERKREARLKHEEQCILQLQRLYRGYISRIKNAVFVAKRREWLKQRKIDDHVRKTLTYALRVFFGVAKELESDTLFEKVLKRYPKWQKNFIIDVVHQEWQLCYDFITAQEKHQKRQGLTAPSVHGQEFVQFLSLYSSLKMKKIAEKAKKKSADKAQQAYRNARSEVGFSEEKKAELQQTMRRVKKDHEHAAEQRQLVETDFKGLLARRSGRWGPRGMPKRVHKIRKEGWAVPFKVEATYTSALLDHPFDDMHASVKPGEYVRVAGSAATYKILVNTGLPGFAKALYYGSVDRWVRFAASLEGLDSLVEEDQKIIESRIPNWKGDDKELRLIKLDRTWTYDSGKDLVIYKLPRLPPTYKVYYKITRSLKASVPIQGMIAAYANFVGTVAKRFRNFGDNFDDDSKNYAYMQSLATKTDAYQARILHMRHALKPPDGDTLLGDLKNFFGTLHRLFKKAKSVLHEKYEAYKEEQRKAKDPFAKWLESPDQVEVKVMWNDGTDERLLGYLKIDRDVPLVLGREFVHRYLWFELNQRLGKKFQYQAKGEGLDLKKEERLTFNSIVQQKLNENREAEYVLVMCPEAEAEKEEIVPWDWDAERLKEEERKKHLSKEELEEEELWSDDEDDGGARFKNVEEQKKRHMKELSTIRNAAAGGKEGEGEAGDVETGNNDGGGASDGAEVKGDTPEQEPEAEEWTQYEDPESGAPYWYNNFTEESTYDDPNGGVGETADVVQDHTQEEE